MYIQRSCEQYQVYSELRPHCGCEKPEHVVVAGPQKLFHSLWLEGPARPLDNGEGGRRRRRAANEIFEAEMRSKRNEKWNTCKLSVLVHMSVCRPWKHKIYIIRTRTWSRVINTACNISCTSRCLLLYFLSWSQGANGILLNGRVADLTTILGNGVSKSDVVKGDEITVQ